MTCRKVRYANLGRANQAIVELVMSGKAKNPNRIHAYWCKKCQAYHVGHRGHGQRW